MIACHYGLDGKFINPPHISHINCRYFDMVRPSGFESFGDLRMRLGSLERGFWGLWGLQTQLL
jgi:hypothetical protein